MKKSILAGQKGLTAAAFGAFTALAPLPAIADMPVSSGVATDLSISDASARINQAGKLRMLSQRFAAAGCNLHAGAAIQSSQDALLDSSAEFETIIFALLDGNERLGIVAPETDSTLREEIVSTIALWQDVKRSGLELTADRTDEAALIDLVEASDAVLTSALRLVPAVAGHYAEVTEISTSNALIIDMAGRQRMLAQRAAKNACLVATGVNAPFAQAELEKAIIMFETTHDALVDGMTSAGIAAAPTEMIVSDLMGVEEAWENMDIFLVKAVDNQNDNIGYSGAVFASAAAVTEKMNDVVGLYSEHSSTIR